MKKVIYKKLFSPIKVNGLRLKNRITTAPLYLGYAAEGGKVSPLMLHHYTQMAQSGAALIVVENASVTPGGSGSPRTLRCDHNRYLNGLEGLAQYIKGEKTLEKHLIICPLTPSSIAGFIPAYRGGPLSWP